MLQGIYFLTLPLICLCSKVLDQFNQKAAIISDYCPIVPGCQDGTHVMCMYYDPKNKMGPECVDVVELSMSEENAQLILDICNRIRSKIANGLGKGEDDVQLPKGFGILRLSWDPELATLAQVWANQCILKTDPCRATKRFQNPGQIIGTRRFTIDSWNPISVAEMYNTTTLTPDKIRHSIITILRAWYETKDEVTTNMLIYVDASADIKNNQFIQLVSGQSTHMGCGLSGYKQYFYSSNFAALNSNVLQIVCNFSYRPRVGEPVYVITPPTEPGYTLRCGCPLGFDEDEDCLCYETDREMPSLCKQTGRCKPSVVVLPIITVEDAPFNTLKQNNNSQMIKTPGRNEAPKRKPFMDYTRSNKNDVHIIKQESVYKTRRITTDVRNRYFGAKSKPTNKLKTKPPHGKNNHKNIHKQSIFAKSAIFELPSSKMKQVVQNASYKQDVKPRKDFSKVQKLVSNYLAGRRNGHSFYKSDDNHNLTYIKSVTIIPYSSNTVSNKVHSLNGFTKHKFTYVDLNSTRTPSAKDEIKPLYEENDLIFMNLLDKLEEEVNNIDFNTKEKSLFDKKIRKIYGTLFQKSVVTEHSLVNGNISMNKENIDHNNILNNENTRNYWLDPNKPNEYTYPNLEDRLTEEKPMKKYYNKINRDIENNKYARHYEQLSYRNDPLDNEDIGEGKLRNVHPRKKSRLNSISKGSPRHENYYLKSDLDEYNSLDSERRRHYYDKLNNLQRKVNTIKKHRRNNFINEGLHLRPVRPSKHGSVRRSKPQEMDLYMPNRARFVHGF